MTVGRSNTGIDRYGTIVMTLLSAMALSGCDDLNARLRKPELAICERYVQSALKDPASFRRKWFNIADLPVTRAMLGEATGNVAAAKSAPNPAIRQVYVQYYGSDGVRDDALGVGICHFALSDDGAGTYVGNIETAVDAAIHENEQRALATQPGKPMPGADCCLASGFDLTRLEKIKPILRGKIVTSRPM